jgi:hypothetical protein
MNITYITVTDDGGYDDGDDDGDKCNVTDDGGYDGKSGDDTESSYSSDDNPGDNECNVDENASSSTGMVVIMSAILLTMVVDIDGCDDL